METEIRVTDLSSNGMDKLRDSLKKYTGIEFIRNSSRGDGWTDTLASADLVTEESHIFKKMCYLGARGKVSARHKGLNPHNGSWKGAADDRVIVVYAISRDFLADNALPV